MKFSKFNVFVFIEFMDPNPLIYAKLESYCSYLGIIYDKFPMFPLVFEHCDEECGLLIFMCLLELVRNFRKEIQVYNKNLQIVGSEDLFAYLWVF